MRISELVVLVNDFDGVDINNLIKVSDTNTCLAYTEIFKNESKKYEENSKEWKVFSLLEAVTNFALNHDQSGDAFIPNFTWNHSRTIIPQDFTEEQLEIFQQLLPKINEPELNARIADVLWERKYGDKPHQFAEIAIEAYLSSAETLLQSQKDQIFSLERINRSVTLSRRIKYKNFRSMFQRIETFVEQDGLEEIVSIRITELLLKSGFVPNSKLLDRSKKRYTQYLEEKNYELADQYCGLIITWFSATKEEDLKKNAQIDQANILVFRAEQNAASANYIAAAAFIKEAIVYFGNIEDSESKRAELKEKLLEYQSKINENLEAHEFSIDLTDFANKAISLIMGKSKEEAILTLAFIESVPKKEAIKQNVLKTQSPLLSLISREIIDDNGRTVANNSPSFGVDESEKEKSLEEDMFSFVSNERGLRVEALIKPCLYQLNLEHRIYENDLFFIVNNNPFVPEDRKPLFIKGLIAGFNSDFIASTHILGLQIENSIRYILNNQGVVTTSLSSEGIQEEIDINRLLDFKELIPILGEDLIFDLKGLLISRFGDNLRNKIAHGLLSSKDFSSSAMIYLWWLILQICAYPQMQLFLSAK